MENPWRIKTRGLRTTRVHVSAKRLSAMIVTTWIPVNNFKQTNNQKLLRRPWVNPYDLISHDLVPWCRP